MNKLKSRRRNNIFDINGCVSAEREREREGGERLEIRKREVVCKLSCVHVS